MNVEALDYYARKFFPHLQPDYARLCVIAVIEARQRQS